MSMSQTLFDNQNRRIDFLGPTAEEGSLPAFFYLALSGEESLTLHPYSQPPLLIADDSIRVFSFTIPGHGPGLNKFHAMEWWAKEMAAGHYPLENFFDQTHQAILWLIEQGLVDPTRIGIGGISRGGFVATHLATRINSIHTLLGFAPLTCLMQLKEFRGHPALERRASELDLLHLVDHLTHLKHVRFYIGNLDTRVGTDSCYHFIRRLAEKGHEKHARHQKIEMMMTQSIGHQGHGTDRTIFEEGSLWAKRHILG